MMRQPPNKVRKLHLAMQPHLVYSNILHIQHAQLEIQEYLCLNDISVREAKFLFLTRCRMLEVRSNYSGSHSDPKCPLCEVEQDTQKHLLVCKKLNNENNIVSEVPIYENLFS